MAQVKFTRHLVRFFPNLAGHKAVQVGGNTLQEVVSNLDSSFPGLGDYLVDEHGRLRKHVNIFVDGEMVHDRLHLTDPVPDGATVHIFQALSGG